MICDKCGKSNIRGLSKCKYCGAKLPETFGGGGFADILSYTTESINEQSCVRLNDDEGTNNKLPKGVRETEMQKLIKKSDKIAKSTRMNSLVGLLAIVLSILIFISLIIYGTVTLNKVNVYINTTTEKFEELNKELKGCKTQLEEFISMEKQADEHLDEDGQQAQSNGNEKVVE